jgi:membrane protease YdiL (CAAX protease family)
MTQEATAADKPRGVKWVFFGAQGLRAGWGVLLFVLVTAVLVVALNLAVHAFVHTPGKTSGLDTLDPLTTLVMEGAVTGVVLLATLITAAIERRSLVTLGFGLRNALPRLLQGLVFGILAMSALVGVLYLCHAITFGGLALHGNDIWFYGAEWAAAFLLVGVSEELVFRGYLQQTLARGLNFRWSALILGVFFTLAHMGNHGESPIGLLLVFTAGAVLSYAVWRTGALWWGIGFHAAWDWMQSFTFGVADSGHPAKDALLISRPAGPDWLSGGSTGPEGSVLTLAIMARAVLVIHFTLRKPDEDLGVKW